MSRREGNVYILVLFGLQLALFFVGWPKIENYTQAERLAFNGIVMLLSFSASVIVLTASDKESK